MPSEQLGLPPVAFGDSVRALRTPEAEAIGVAGLIGSVYGVTTPSVTGVSVVGVLADDVAFNVHFETLGRDYWFPREFIEFVDHGAGATVTLAGVPKKWVRSEDGRWVESSTSNEAVPAIKLAPEGLFQRFLSFMRRRR